MRKLLPHEGSTQHTFRNASPRHDVLDHDTKAWDNTENQTTLTQYEFAFCTFDEYVRLDIIHDISSFKMCIIYIS